MFICSLHSFLWGEKETSQKKSAEVVIMLDETLLLFIFGVNAEQLYFFWRSLFAFSWVRLTLDYTMNPKTHTLYTYLLHWVTKETSYDSVA